MIFNNHNMIFNAFLENMRNFSAFCYPREDYKVGTASGLSLRHGWWNGKVPTSMSNKVKEDNGALLPQDWLPKRPLGWKVFPNMCCCFPSPTGVPSFSVKAAGYQGPNGNNSLYWNIAHCTLWTYGLMSSVVWGKVIPLQASGQSNVTSM